ncbi:MAG: hypothetical protein HXX18_03720 [Bacteroidetes bacterium]|nr:hypothetical protein [Bacteroidota bacterium]
MNYFKEKKFAFWAIVILVVLNVATLSMIWLHKPPRPFPPPPRSEKLIPDFVIAELKLNATQQMAFNESEQQQMRKITPLLDSLHQYKQQLFLSAFENSTDTANMKIMIHQIGLLAEKIDLYTFYHVIELGNICNVEQKQMLKDLFMDMGKLRRGERKGE